MQGILLIEKPKGWTSFDVVNYVRKLIAREEGKKTRNVKVGHIGTLDPLATGLLVLLVNKAYTRRAPTLSKLDKTYEVIMRLGEVSSTGDEEGEKRLISTKVPTLQEIKEACVALSGNLMQTPPIFSAIKVDGVRAYKLARAGKSVVLQARPITVYENVLISYQYPFVHFRSRVSSGTYIRSLVEDMGQYLKTGAYISELRRLKVGTFSLDDAVSVQFLDPERLSKSLQVLT